ncbi:hypothetical protein FNB15_12330 [Ferrovibrio terrae]|uniref:Piwi domain-containing protein n=1 Tax=Ferrovibrio terrae TaxID=2594003 RepID=A0A516H2K9_9PROT|nr:hypothetical protein [Ferrovibrio terrae]QDO98008.1 hypothetical protein FNB15_12330 [Ferrovibrio terrae]
MEYPEKSLRVLHLEEPGLEFGFKQVTAHPKDGLHLYGPYKRPKRTREIRLGVIGTNKGLDHFRTWANAIRGVVSVPEPGPREKKDRLHLATFPGLEEALSITFNDDATTFHSISESELEQATLIINHHEAVSKTASLYANVAISHLANDERTVDVWLLVVPEIVYERCRPLSKRTGLTLVPGGFKKKQKARVSMPLFGDSLDEPGEHVFDDTPDFHRHIKASFLGIAPTQVLRETTLAPEAFLNTKGYPVRKTQDRATKAWNVATGLYYKTQADPPWRLANIREGVCYIGLVFKDLPNDKNKHACCAAQMFLREGDGVVFRGANGPWKTNDYEHHLTRSEASNLIKQVLDAYREEHGTPKELFIHGRTKFNDEEWAAFENAVPAETNIVGVRITTGKGENKLFRDGDYPVLRGTALIQDERNALLWSTGYIPQLDTYIGPETPNPLSITILRSKANRMPKIEDVLEDILGLTKINYNSCNFNDGLPVTVRFANMVGDILTMGSAKSVKKQPFKFYV